MSKSEKTPNADILTYLQKMSIYPFDPKIDQGFVEEIVADFGSTLDILEETKAFRWYHIDQATPYEGGIVDVFGDTSRGEVLSAHASASYWAELAEYEEPGRKVVWPDRDPDDGTEVVATTWSEPGKTRVTTETARNYFLGK